MKLLNKIYLLAAIAGIQFITSCNKDLETIAAPATVTPAVPTGDTIRKFISANAKYALFDSCLNITGLKTTVLNQAGNLTVFAADTTAYKQLAYGLSVAIGAADLTLLSKPNDTAAKFFRARATVVNLRAIIQYNIMEGKVMGSAFLTTFPNITYPSFTRLDAANPANDALRIPMALSLRGTQTYLNSIALNSLNVFTGFNGVVHESPSVNVPPSGTLKTAMAGEATLTYFRAAVARADSGAVGLSKIDSLLNYGLTNMTVLAPNDSAFKTLVYGLAYAAYLSTRPKPYTATDSATAAATGNGAVAAGPAFLATNNVSTAQVKGIVAYHVLATNSTGSYTPNIRVFSVNVPAAPAFVKTLVNGAIAVHPGIFLQAFYTGPVADSIKFTGFGTFPPGGAAYSAAAGTSRKVSGMTDKHAVNGVYHIIDRVLLPQ
jgi:uncharacterized surface protein with fasciclin (FAS1) repeats